MSNDTGNTQPKILFSDHFNVDKKTLDEYGAFDISLVADFPLFIDPFLLFNSKKPEYQQLHDGMIAYLRFLRDKSISQPIDKGLLAAWYRFKEVKQNWLGFSVDGNSGSALGADFAKALNENFAKIFTDYGQEKVTRSSHLEKLCLIKDGVGKDNISDFTTNLTLDFLLQYTQAFAKKHIDPTLCQEFRIPRVRFNYETESWEEGTYLLPSYQNDFVILTPKDLLTKDETWINKNDLVEDFYNIPNAISNDELRAKVNNYFRSVLPKDPKKKDEKEAAVKTILAFPELIDYYIKHKEDNGDRATSISEQKVAHSELMYVDQFTAFAKLLAEKTDFYKTPYDSYDEAMQRVQYLKSVIENNDGYRFFYVDNEPIRREEDLKIAYRLTWRGSTFDFNTEVNNGRGPVDVKVSKGSADKSLVELKLATNTQLERNLQNQVGVYEEANDTKKSIKVIIYFTFQELRRVQGILKRLGLEGKENIVLIDARKDNKTSASKV